MEMRFQFGFKHELHHSLGNTIRDRRNPEPALTTAFLWNQNFLHGRGKGSFPSSSDSKSDTSYS